MTDSCFGNADGDMLIVPQHGMTFMAFTFCLLHTTLFVRDPVLLPSLISQRSGVERLCLPLSCGTARTFHC